ncbi:Rare lipoprotein A precursor [hydrothermal vent metagenome]|uniref:Rare lipoprotein A n=1 Tax=hydrothermal vent metagenome TaxID=652676 RepID=A0A3B0TV63_9ZZZZ
MNKVQTIVSITVILTVVVIFIIALQNKDRVEDFDNFISEHPSIEESTDLSSYEVKTGDTIIGIAKKFNILPWQLRTANNMSGEDTLIHPGEMLYIPLVIWETYHGKASWYGPNFHGKKMANGMMYDQEKILVAHRILPLGIHVRITNLNSGKSIVAQVLDRGPYAKNADGEYSREIDLSYGAAKELGAIEPGVIPVKIEPLG